MLLRQIARCTLHSLRTTEQLDITFSCIQRVRGEEFRHGLGTPYTGDYLLTLCHACVYNVMSSYQAIYFR